MRYVSTAALVAVLAAGVAVAEDTTVRTYALATHGAFALKVPKSWNDSVQQPPDNLPPTLTLSPKQGAPFQVIVTPVWRVNPSMQMPGPEQMRTSVQRAADGASRQAVEKSIPVKEFKGADGKGYYFLATDKAPRPGEFKYLTQGMLGVNDLAVAFTILTNDGQEGVIKDALSMLSTAAHRH